MVIQLENIRKSYNENAGNSNEKVLDGINFTINSSDSVAIIGPSGSGKTTLLNILGTLDRPSSGIIMINGVDISGFDDKKMAGIRNRKIGFVFQQHHLLPQLNLMENILLPTLVLKDLELRNSAVNRAGDLLEMVGLTGKIKLHPWELSVGECQRVAVIRALINKPEIILAEEPTGSLDQDSAAIVGDLLVKIHNEQMVALVVVTHSTDLAYKMESVYRLSNGKLITD